MIIRKWLILPIALLIVALSVISVTTLFAKEDGATSSAIAPFASKVANIIGMDEITVAQAIKQAQSELRTERISKKLRQMVEEGELTQEQADEKLADLASDFEANGGVWGKGKMKYARATHARNKDFQKKLIGSREGIEEKLRQMVEEGELTQEEANEKLAGLTSGARAKDGPSDKMRYAKADHAWGKGLQKKGRGNREGVTEIISQMVDNGILAQDDADRKLEALGLA